MFLSGASRPCLDKHPAYHFPFSVCSRVHLRPAGHFPEHHEAVPKRDPGPRELRHFLSGRVCRELGRSQTVAQRRPRLGRPHQGLQGTANTEHEKTHARTHTHMQHAARAVHLFGSPLLINRGRAQTVTVSADL